MYGVKQKKYHVAGRGRKDHALRLISTVRWVIRFVCALDDV